MATRFQLLRLWSVVLLVLVGAAAVAGARKPSAFPFPPARQIRLGTRFADLVLTRWPDPAAIDPARNGWEYNTGIVLFGMSKMYDRSGDPRYLAYIRRWVDSYVDEQGKLGWNQERTHNLDYIQPANLILFLYERTGEDRYKIAARTVREAIDKIPRNKDGGFWHKSIYPNEMWIDGIYMAGPFLMRYGALVGDTDVSQQIAVDQALLVARHCFDQNSGLLYHAWDQDRNAAWANKATGVSPVFWSRGMGWYVMALVDILELLPASHPGYPELHRLLRETVRGLSRVQDPKTGLWFEVLDQGKRRDNWIETSSSGMFIYAIRKAVSLGLIDATYMAVAERAWKGLQATIEQDSRGRPVFTGAVQGMGVQTRLRGLRRRSRGSRTRRTA